MTTKPFNLEEAKAGAKLVTRDGRPARIGIWDAKSPLPIIGCILLATGEEIPYRWSIDGMATRWEGYKDECDLLIPCEPKLRAWTLDEVPIGALYRDKREPNSARVILTATPEKIIIPYESGVTYRLVSVIKDDGEHSTDGGKTFKPCGVEI